MWGFQRGIEARSQKPLMSLTNRRGFEGFGNWTANNHDTRVASAQPLAHKLGHQNSTVAAGINGRQIPRVVVGGHIVES